MRWSSVLRRIRRRPARAPAGEALPPLAGFDWRAYRASHRDLVGHASPAALLDHYLTVGRAEGRAGDAAAVRGRIAALETRQGPLPEDFRWAEYLANYPDLAGLTSEIEAAEHYLKHGRIEGRLVRRFDVDLYRSLYFAGAVLPDDALHEDWRSVGQEAGRVCTYEGLLQPHGVRGTAWLRSLDLETFNLLNAGWAGTLPHKGAVVDAMMREGFARCAPLGFGDPFDPAYYREANPRLARLDAAALYRHWLDEGAEGGRPGSPADHLARHGLRLPAFPSGFDWRSYRRLPAVFGDSRWALLDHVVAHGEVAADAIPVHPEGAGAFLAALAVTIADRDVARGLALFQAAARFGALSPDAEERWARAELARGDATRALARARTLLDQPACTIDTASLAVEAALAAGDPAAALEGLRVTRDSLGGTPRFRALLGTVLGSLSRQARERAEAMLVGGRRAEANALLADRVRAIDAAWRALDPSGIPIPAEPRGRVVMLANTDLPQCTHYRVLQKAEVFAAAGIPFAWFPADAVDAFLTALPGAAAALFYRLPATPGAIRAIGVARALGIPTLYDIDDLIFDPEHYPEPIETYGGGVTPLFHARLALGAPLFRAAMALCDTGMASTTALARHVAAVVRDGTAAVLPNGLDSRNRRWLDRPPARVRRDAGIVLFYGSGTKAHNSDFLDLAGDALLATLSQHPDVTLRVAGHLTLDARFDTVRDRIVQVGWMADLDDYWSLLAESDVVLAPLAAGPTTDGKSEIKWLEAAALGIPCIVSASDRYREVLEHDVDALLAATPADWHTAIDALVTRPDRRAALAEAARRKARALYALDRNAERLQRLLAPTLRRALAPPPRSRKRLMLVNIFFPPQTVGGSTRVVRDNLDAFLGSAFSAACDFAVVTSDNDNPFGQHSLRVDDYRGVPVFRIGVPGSPVMEWRPFDPGAGALFGRILDLWRPDLVHVHSIQRLTASVLVECWRRGIPYINTLHDAWWVSDYHFLTDARGRPRQPGEALPLDPPPSVTLGQSLERRRRLRPLLEHSAEILCVSDAFTALHHRAGYPRTRCVPNGVPTLQPTPRVPSPDGAVRLAQIGSQTHHKGYHLVRAALMRGRFAHLRLTVVDHSRYAGRVDTAVWGATPVSIVGKTRQEDMHRFYASQDVLLAPSVWPESFGLVAREAIAAGLWVVASDRGAIGEPVVPGRNGWIVDVGSVDPLVEVLAAIDAEPARYTRPPPPPATPARTAADQADELIGIYRSVFARPRSEEPLPVGLDAPGPP